MKTPKPMQAGQIEKLARFLEEHPGFSPQLIGEDAYVCGFQVGKCFLSVEDTEKLIDAHIDARLPEFLQTAPPELSKRRSV